jgi:hypothetical protein
LFHLDLSISGFVSYLCRAMLDLNQILRANEINFAVLAAMPAFLGVFLLGWLLKKPFTKVGFLFITFLSEVHDNSRQVFFRFLGNDP